MIGIQNTNIVKIFISSNCDHDEDKQRGNAKYSIMRKSLKLLLESTEVCGVYIFEEGTATSYSVVSSFVNPLEDSDLVIVIVDNKDGIGEGTQKEISRAVALKKKCIYVFCNEREKEPTELEKQLLNSTTNPRYFTVSEFASISEEVYKSVVNDILSIYTSYCRGRVELIDKKQFQVPEVIDDTGLSVAEDGNFSKEYIFQFPYTKALVKKEAGLLFGEEPKATNTDKICSDLLGYIIGSQLTELPSFKLIRQDIKQMHKGNMQKLVAIRYEAVESYFSGDLSGCIKSLEEAVAFINSCKNIPKWLLNDVAIDLRNVQIEIDYEKGIMNIHPYGQDILDADKEPLYYPIIDRIVSDYNEGIIKSHFNHSTQSPYTVNLGGADYTLEKATNAFIVAYYYGSITQMLMTRKRIYDYTLGLSLEVRNHRLFMFTVRLLLLSCEEKILRQFIDTYGENTNNINSNDAECLLVSIGKQPVRYKRLLARENVLRFFGYYYSDPVFNQESEELVNEVKKSITDGYTGGMLIKPLLNAIKETSYRFQEKAALEFILFIFENNYGRYYDDAFWFLYGFRFTTLTKKEQKSYQSFMVKALKNSDIRNNFHGIYQAVQTLRQCETIDHKPLDKVVKKYNEVFYENTYRLNVEEHNLEQGWGYTERFVEEIKKDNLKQGKGGMYSAHAYDPYLTISNILVNNKLKYSSNQLKMLVNAIGGTIFTKTQTIEAKVRALELLCVIQLNQPANRQISNLYKDIVVRREEILEAMDLFLDKGYGIANINLCISILGMILKQGEGIELGIRLVEIQNNDISEQITALCFLERLYSFDFSKNLSNAYDVLFQFLLNESFSSNSDVRFRSMSVMSKISEQKYRELCLERFVNIMDEEDYKGKVGLLYRLKEEDLENPKVQFIFDKGKADSHYWVRVAANRFD